ncbi:MAG: hypothetical protein JOZ78_14960 [Chroococcidiopsidaceae cyanobacterium CP_BM_ER_R8_30]|nr:hypothetical protein [Chroococcidiopsidaceae cyanobacterium CP_BM_ER_R8_30]
MKRTLAFITVISYLFPGNFALASSFKARCLNHQGELSDCIVNVNNNHLQVKYKSRKNQDLNINVSKSQITYLSRREYSSGGGRSGISTAGAVASNVGAVFFPPIAIANLFGYGGRKKVRVREQIGLEYRVNQKAHSLRKATVIEISSQQGFALQQELQAMTGIRFHNE